LSPVSTALPTESVSQKIQPRELSRQEIAPPIPATIPLAVMPSVEKIEEENAIEARSLLTEIESARRGKQTVDADFPAAEPILIRKKEAAAGSDGEANQETNDVSFAPASISVREKPASKPIAGHEQPLGIAEVEAAPIFVKRKEAAPVTTSPETIDLPGADVREERKIQSTAPISTAIHKESHRQPLPSKRPLYVGAGLLVLLASVLLGALLYNRQRQTAAPPTTAQTSPVNAPPETISGTTDNQIKPDAAQSDRSASENSAPSRIEKSSQAATGRENQPAREMPAAENTVGRNESGGNQTARANPTNGTGAQAELNTSLADWVSATNSRNIDRQMNHYASKINAYYRVRNASPETVRAEKRRVFARADQVDIQTGKPEITVSPDGRSATMRFRKKYAIKEGGRSRSGEVVQELQWVKSDDGWRIVSERDVKVIDR
jgi:ketosteroid isomerase-like protein